MVSYEKFFRLVRSIPKGKVTTYKELALKLGTGPRAVGRMLNTYDAHVKIPCHRVIMSDESIGGYKGGVGKKKKLLLKEGVKIKKGKISKEFFVHL